MAPQLRIARPVYSLARVVDMYCRGLGCRVLASFEDPDGYRVVLRHDEWPDIA